MFVYYFAQRLVVWILFTGFFLPAYLQAGIKIDGSLTHEKQAQRGDTYQGVIAIRNTGNTVTEVKVYQTDYIFFADGRNDYGDPGKLSRSNAPWLHLNKEQFIIPAGGVANAYYEVKVPDGLALHGTYWSMVMVEPVSGREATVGRLKKGQTQLAQIMRYGIQIVTQLGETGKATLVFQNPKLDHKKSKRVFTVDLKNTGERWIRPQLWLDLYDTQGRPVQKIESHQQRLYPGTSVRSHFDLSGVPRGEYQAFIVADGGGNDLFGVQVELTF